MEEENLGSAVDTAADTSSVETTDNSSQGETQELSLDEQIAKALDEPETSTQDNKEEETAQPPKTEEPQEDNTVKCPDKFKNKDGSVNIDKVLKSYTELESHNSTEKSNWEKERADLLKVKEQYEALQKVQEQNAKNAGYNSALDMKQSYEIASIEANEYSKYLGYCEDPESVRQLLIAYANNPSQELMEQIEMEFAPDVNKHIAVISDRKAREFETQQQQRSDTIKMTNIENIISTSVDKNQELFNYEPFKKLLVNTLHRYGENFTQEDADILMQTFVDMKGAYQSEFEKGANMVKQNNAATDKLSSITTQNSAPVSGQNPDLDSMSQSELEKYIAKYV